MTIAEKIARAKADYDEVFEAGKKSVLSVLDFSDIESTTYRVTVPSGADDFARVNKIGGMSYKTRNLLRFPYDETTITRNGITFTSNADGSVTLNGTNNGAGHSSFHFSKITNPIRLSAGTYIGSTGNSNVNMSGYDGTSYYSFSTETPKFASSVDLNIYIQVNKGNTTTFNNVVIYPMLNEGTTALPYEPYFEGLRNAEVTELKSDFGNLFNYDNIIDKYKGTGENAGKIWVNSTGYSANFYTGTNGSSVRVPREYWDKLMYLTKGTYYAYYEIDFYENEVPETDRYIQARAIHLDGTDFWCGQGGQQLFSGGSFTMYEDGYCYLRSGINKRCYISNLMITRTPRTEYVPYKPDILPISEAIKSLDGYGLGKNADEYNYIDFGNKIFKQEYAKVRLPSNKGTFNADSKWYYISKTELGISPLSREILCNLLPSADITANSTISGIYMSASQMNYVLIRKTEFTTEAEYKQWLADNEVYIIERLAEPIETDISAYLTDEYIEVEGGGTVTVVNENQLDAPTNISYLIDTQGG